MSRFWMVRAGTGGALAQEFLEKKCIAVGYGMQADLNGFKDKEQIKQLLSRQDPDLSIDKINSWASSLHRFKTGIAIGDTVIFYSPSTREYHIGQVAGDCVFDPNIIKGDDAPQVRTVAWKHTISRDDLCVASRNTLGSLLAIFEPGDEVRDEFDRLLHAEKPASPPPETAELEPVDALRQEFVDKAHEFIKDRILKLDWQEMQELVAAILRSLGYRTRVSPPGTDRGKDIVASPDGLGLSSPRIKVEVKHRAKQQMGAPEIRSFIGGLRGEDRGLYVSTGGFTTEAGYEAERASVPVSLLTLDDLASLLVQHYEKLDSDGRALVPLLRVYWPAS